MPTTRCATYGTPWRADSIRVDSHDYDEIDAANPPRDAVFIWSVGSNTVLVGCRAGTGETDRRLRGPDYFRDMLRFFAEIDDYWRYGKEDNPRYPADYELRCNVNIAADCTAPLSPDVNDFGGGTTRLMPLRRGQFLLLFRCCRVCEGLAGKIADTNFKISIMEAQAKLPPGAVIDPGSPVPPRP